MLPFVDRGKWFFLKGKATQLPGFRKEQNRRCCNAPVCGFANAIHWISALTPRALTSGETRVRSQSRSALGWSLSLPGANVELWSLVPQRDCRIDFCGTIRG